MSTQAGVENLSFDMRLVSGEFLLGLKHSLEQYERTVLVSDDWTYDRSSNVFHLGDLIPVEASVRVGHHLGLRVFVSSCTATLSPDALSHPRHVFIENG